MEEVKEVLTWETILGQDRVKSDLLKLLNSDKLSHALLFVGVEGIGKKLMGKILAKALLTGDYYLQNNNLQAQQFDGGNYPDFIYIEPDKEKTNPLISIVQIREMQNALARSAYFEGYRVVLIDDAHCLNEAAMNALLKTLEEPSKDVLFILVTAQREKLLPTILSRCTQVYFNPLNIDVLTEILVKKYAVEEMKGKVLANMSGGGIVRALELLADEHGLRDLALNYANERLSPPKIWNYTDKITNLGKAAGKLWGEYLLMYLRDLLCIRSGTKENILYHLDKKDFLADHAYDMEVDEIFQKIALTEKLLKEIQTNADLARALQNFMLKWRHIN